MRLLNTRTHKLENIPNPDKYAILSHTWAEGEVTFEDIRDIDIAARKAGWGKIMQTCRLAAAQGLEYAWVDTCCIDTSSSAELSEAINSMFTFYSQSTVCYVYLSDLGSGGQSYLEPDTASAKRQLASDLPRCRWFTRGWTLQELIAPSNVEFYDRCWVMRGTKRDLRDQLASITKIDPLVLLSPSKLPSVPVGRKMSWAANRQTTRVEDVAYCLLGIFDVNMPMIYGEGEKAFLRLQEAIALSVNDLSLFAWTDNVPEDWYHDRWHGVFARSPRQFANCHQLVHLHNPVSYSAHSFAITNRGVEFRTCLKMDRANGDYLMHLNCTVAAFAPQQKKEMAIRLLKTPSGYVRHRAGQTVFDPDTDGTNDGPANKDAAVWDASPQSVCVRKVVDADEFHRVSSRFHNSFWFQAQLVPPWSALWQTGWSFVLTTFDPRRDVQSDADSLSPPYWDASTSRFMTDGQFWFTGLLYLSLTAAGAIPPPPILVFCGFGPGGCQAESELRPWVAPWGQLPWKAVGSGPNTIDLSDVVSKRYSMHYPRFLSYAGRVIREQLAEGKTLCSTLASQSHRISASVSVTTIPSKVEATHRVSISVNDLRYPEVPASVSRTAMHNIVEEV